MGIDLLRQLNAADVRENYVHQIHQTIEAYLPAFVFIGEALQNALDAVRESGSGAHEIKVDISLPERRVTVIDDGTGFPDKPSLLYLGGGLKRGKGLGGLVGVGLKVVLFSSREFELRATNSDGSLKVRLEDAYRYGDATPPDLTLPNDSSLPKDPVPLFPSGTGTRISYTFPAGEAGVPERFFRDVAEACISDGPKGFVSSLQPAVTSGQFPSRLAVLLAVFLRRFTYVGSTNPPSEYDDLKIKVRLDASNSALVLGELSELLDGKDVVEFDVAPNYFSVKDSLSWTTGKKPSITSKPLGSGGSNLERAALGFNVTAYSDSDGYRGLLVNSRGKESPLLARLETRLFPKLRGVTVTIGRIPQFRKYLPGGSQRVISARGVVTTHSLNITSGRNQQYLHCVDIVVDVDADMNYGKTQLTDMHLVSNVNRFVDEAYRCVLQNAAENFVGNEPSSNTTKEKFWERPEMSLPELSQLRVPYDENDVIALLFELTGRGYFSEYRWFGLSSVDRYDARAVIALEGSRADLLEAPQAEDLRVVEFKMRGASVARDFDTEQKEQKDVDLVICYEVGVSPVSTYQVIPIEDSDVWNGPQGAFPGATHVLYDTVTDRETQIMALSTLLADVTDEAPPALPADVGDEPS